MSINTSYILNENNEQFGDLIHQIQSLHITIEGSRQEILSKQQLLEDEPKSYFFNRVELFTSSKDQYNECKRFIMVYENNGQLKDNLKDRIDLLSNDILKDKRILDDLIEQVYNFNDYNICETIRHNIIHKAIMDVGLKQNKVDQDDIAYEITDILTNFFFDKKSN